MGRWRVRLVAAVCLVGLAPAVGQTQGEVVAGLVFTGTVDAAAQSIRESANSVVQQVESSFGASSFAARQDVAYLLAEVDHIATRQQGKLFRNLTAQERDVFVGADNLLQRARREADGTVRGTKRVAQTLDSGVSRLPFADRTARVLESSPAYLISTTGQDMVTISAEGSQLARGPASLKIGNLACGLLGQTDTKLNFECPGGLFRAGRGPRVVSADLGITVPKGILETITFRPARTKAYRLLTVVVPPTLGTWTLTGATETTIRKTEPRDGKIRRANAHCEGERWHSQQTFPPRQGWKIDTTTIKLGSIASTNRGVYVEGPNGASESGFAYRLKLQNGGSCERVAGRVVSKDARAWHTQAVHWTEFQDVVHEQPLSVKPGSIAWGRDVAIALPANLKWFRMTITQIDGQERTVIDRDEKNDWFTLDHDASRRTMVIRPRTLADAMAAR